MKTYAVDTSKLTEVINALYKELNAQKAVLENTVARPRRAAISSDLYYLRLDIRLAKYKRRMMYK